MIKSKVISLVKEAVIKKSVIGREISAIPENQQKRLMSIVKKLSENFSHESVDPEEVTKAEDLWDLVPIVEKALDHFNDASVADEHNRQLELEFSQAPVEFVCDSCGVKQFL